MPFVDLHCDTIARLLACRRAGLPGQLRTGEEMCIRDRHYGGQNF